ncbi:MAG: hypothetical protein JSS32_08705 [Verrucomicrobia bacterium]|nr:hypothetical protein [Verrucomicrobiota bacterium]
MNTRFLMALVVGGAAFGCSELGDSPPSKGYLAMEKGVLGYRTERELMTGQEIQNILLQGRELLEGTDIVATLMDGGSALFPHASILKCGDQIAAVAQAALKAAQQSGKNKILVLGVLHSLSEEIWIGRQREIAGEDVTDYPCRGIFGPGLPHEAVTKREYSVDNFVFLLKNAVRESGSPPIEIVIRFPNHISGHPETLQGMDELRQLAKESIVVATADLRHHGVNYGFSLEKARPIHEETLIFARQEIQLGLDMLESTDLISYRNYCYKTISDAFEVGQALHALLGPLKAQIHHIRLVSVSDLFDGHPEPNWVATCLVELKALQKASGN